MSVFGSKQDVVLRRMALAGVSALALAAAEASLADNLLVGSGGQGGIPGNTVRATGGAGGIGGGGGGDRGGGGGGIGGGVGGAGDAGGAGGSGSPSSAAGGSGGSGTAAGGNGNIGGGGGSGFSLSGGGGGAIGALGGAGGSNVFSGGRGGNNGGGGGGAGAGGVTGGDGANGTNGTTTTDASGNKTIGASELYDFVGIGGGGGGAGGVGGSGAGAGTAATLTIDGTGSLNVSRSLLIGGAGGGASHANYGGGGGSGSVSLLSGGNLSVAETLLVGGSGGGGGGGSGSLGPQHGGAGGAGSLTVNSGASVTIAPNGRLILGGMNGGDGSSGTGGAGTLNLGGDLDFGAGATFTINANSTYNLGNAVAGGASTGAITGLSGVTNNGTINFNQSNASYTFSAAISGSGGVNQNGSGVTVLCGTNTYTGSTTIAGGRLRAGGTDVIASSSALTLSNASGAVFDLNNFNQSIRTLSGGGGAGGNITLGSATLTVNQTADATYSGQISGTGAVTKAGSGTLTLDGASTYTGATTISAGTLGMAGSGSIAASSGVQVDGTFDISAATSGVTVNNLSGAAASGTVKLGANNLTVVQQGAFLEFAGALSGTGTLVKQGAGGFTLVGNSSGFLGTTQVATGILYLSNSGGTTSGRLGGNVTVASGATLEGAGGTIGGAVSVAAGGTLGWTTQGSNIGGLAMGSLVMDPGAIASINLLAPVPASSIFTVTGNATVNGTLNLETAPGYGAGVYRVFSTGGTLTNAGLVLGQMPAGYAFQIDIQATTLDVVATTPDTSLQYWSGNGTTRGGGGNWTPANPWLNASGGNAPWAGLTGVFDGPAGIVHVNGTQGFGTLEFLTSGYQVQAGTAGMLDLGTGGRLWAEGSDTVAAVSAPITGAGALTKIGLGTLVLSGTNTYQGGTVLQAGTLQVASDASLGNAAGAITFTGGELKTTASFTSARNLVLSSAGMISPREGTTLTLTGAVSGAGALILGSGALALKGSNTYQGGTALYGSTLQVSADGNLGAAAGGLAFSGGTLETSANFTSARSIVLNAPGTTPGAQPMPGGGTFAVAGGTSLTLSGIISGAGALTKAGAGSLIIAGDGAYTGGTLVAAGTLMLATSAAAGTGGIRLADGATLGFANGITVANALALGGDVTFDLATGSATASGTLSGTGSVTYTGGGLFTLTGDSSAFGGTTTVNSALSVNGMLGGSVAVASGGTLKGTGIVGPTSIAAGGTIAPGNSIGTLTVNGPLAFAAGSTYAVEINPQGQSDLIAATGGATLGGAKVSVTKAPGSYLPGTRYTILTAAGGISGSFGSLTQDLPFVDLALAYDPNAVILNVVRNQTQFSGAGVTANQITTARAVETLGPGNALYNAVVSQTTVAGARQAFNALDGEVYPSAMSALQDESLIVRRTVLDQARVSLSRASLSNASNAAGSNVIEVPGTPHAFWSQAFGAWGQIGGNGNAAAISGNTAGVIMGYDRTVAGSTGDWRLGFAAGYSSSRYQVDARSSSFTSDNAHVAIYSGGTFGSLGLRLGGAYSWADMSARRSVVFPGFNNALSASPSARTGQVFGEVGYGASIAGVSMEPFAGLAYVNVDLNNFAEWAGPSALTAHGTGMGVTYSTLGARVSVPLALGAVATSFRGTLAWQHAFGDTHPEALLAFRAGAQ